jgi:lysophospholipase L1-like esterase
MNKASNRSENEPLQQQGRGFDGIEMRKSSSITAATANEGGTSILSVVYDQLDGPLPDQFTATVDFPFSLPIDAATDGISFEVRGDGSDAYASVLLAYGETDDVALGYEAIFPLASKDWKKVILRWNSFVQNYLPWEPRSIQDNSTTFLDPKKVGRIGFGLGHYFHNHYPRHVTFQIRNISPADRMAAGERTTFSVGWSHLKTLLGRKHKLNLMLIGDSITQLGSDESYGHHLGLKIQEKWGNEFAVANCGVGGHSVRGGTIVLPRSLRTMPHPDLVFVFFGANDGKALGLKKEFGQHDFRMKLERLIDAIRTETQGIPDICLLSGVPRLLPDSAATSGTLEKIVDGVKEAALEKKTAFVDTFHSYLRLSPEERALYYRDTVHPKPEGQVFLGTLIFDTLRAEMADLRPLSHDNAEPICE